MEHSQSQETAYLYNLGLLNETEFNAASERLRTDREFAAEVQGSEAVADEVLSAMAVKPPAALRERLLSGLAAKAPVGTPETLPPGLLVLTRKEEGKWRPTGFSGVTAKRLYADSESGNTTWLLKLEPGAVYPSHRHAAHEHCYVIDGDVAFENYSLTKGDFGVAAAGSDHSPFTTRGGCLLLIVNNERDEFIS